MTQPTLSVVVKQRELQAQAVAVITLMAANGAPLPAYTAGAHIDVHLPGGLVRQYSLCGDPRERSNYRLAVLKDPASRGGSIAVQTLTEGATLSIGEPRNHFPLAPDAAYHVLCGGGIGITPMITMAWELHAAGKPFELHYSARSRSQAALLGELASVPWASKATLYFDDEGTKLDPVAALEAAPAGRHIYVCGPTGFMDWVMYRARAAGLTSHEIHREYFSAPAHEVTTPDAAFEVVAKKSGRSVKVEAGQSIRDALKTIGIKVDVSCEEGVCGTCLCTVLEGEPDHRDAYLTDEEREANDQILVCCSRSKSPRLVLDI